MSIEYKNYSDQEIIEFKDYMEKFRVTKTLSNGQTVTYIDELPWLKEQGALNSYGAVILDGSVPNKYQVCMNKIAQLNNFIRRKEYGRKMHLERIGLEVQKETEIVGDMFSMIKNVSDIVEQRIESSPEVIYEENPFLELSTDNLPENA